MAKANTRVKTTRLYRSDRNRILGGVAGGLGKYFDLDPNIIRLIFILLTIFGGSGVPIYLILWVLLPSESSVYAKTEDNMRENVAEIKEKTQQLVNDTKIAFSKKDVQFWLAIFFIIIGIFFLLGNFGFFYYFNMIKLWPLVLIALGLAIFLKQ